MKKIILAFALLISMAWAAPASALGFDWGITGGLNLTQLKLKGETKQNFKSDNRAGWYFGAKANVSLLLGFGLDGSIVYSQQKYNLNQGNHGSSSETSRSIAVPLNVRYNIGIGSIASAFVATGPQFDFNIGNKDWYNAGTFARENMTTSWNIGAGVKLLGHLEVGVGYNFALGKVGEALLNQAQPGIIGHADDVKSNTFKVSAAIYF